MTTLCHSHYVMVPVHYITGLVTHFAMRQKQKKDKTNPNSVKNVTDLKMIPDRLSAN